MYHHLQMSFMENSGDDSRIMAFVDARDEYTIAGGIIYVESPSGDLKRFQFRIEPTGEFTIIEAL